MSGGRCGGHPPTVAWQTTDDEDDELTQRVHT